MSVIVSCARDLVADHDPCVAEERPSIGAHRDPDALEQSRKVRADELGVVRALVEAHQPERQRARDASRGQRVVDDDDRAAVPGHPRHLADDAIAHRGRHLVERERDAGDIETTGRERQAGCIGPHERDVRRSVLSSGDCEHRLRQVDADDLRRHASERERLRAGAGRDVEDAGAGQHAGGVDDVVTQTTKWSRDRVVVAGKPGPLGLVRT